jgi:hypothetical protein
MRRFYVRSPDRRSRRLSLPGASADLWIRRDQYDAPVFGARRWEERRGS